MKKIFIDKHYYPHITKMLDSFDKKERLPLLTFIINQSANHICLIGGKNNEPTMVELPFDGQDPTLQDGTWSIDADMFKYYYHHCLKNVLDNEHICSHAESDSILINVDNEQLTVTDGQHYYSRSLASLIDFENKSKIDYKTEVKFVVNISRLFEEIDEYIKVNEIKKNNTTLLYIVDNEAYISGFGFTVEGFKSLSALYISAKESFLYNVNLKQLNAIKIRDITSMKGMILRILKAPDGSRKLGLYNEHDTQLPYNSIPIILDTNSHNLKAMQNLLPLDKKNRENSFQQPDLIGFDDI